MAKFIYKIPTFGEMIRYEVLKIEEGQAILKDGAGVIKVVASDDFDQFAGTIPEAIERAIVNNNNFLAMSERRSVDLRVKLANLQHMRDTFQIKPEKKAKA